MLCAMVAALVVANTNSPLYNAFLDTNALVGIGEWRLQKPILLWINDGMMAVFFLMIGLELKREILFGSLSNRKKIALPVFAALGGMGLPILIYISMNWGDPKGMNGWAIPAATDIAFSLGLLAMLGKRIPLALKVLLASVAVIDDIGAIIFIAVFYSHEISYLAHGCATILTAVLFMLHRKNITSSIPYVLVGIALWAAVLKSGIHATLAGIVLAAFIPAGDKDTHSTSLACRIETGLSPWIHFGILPLFAFANAGIVLHGLKPSMLLEPVSLGIALGLFAGKQLGIFTAAWLAVKMGLARLPAGLRWGQVYGLAALCGIGFTMSLFIGSLAFEVRGGSAYMVNDRVGILTGSLLSGTLGMTLLLFTCPKPRA
jgi:NhaA family Na+:H+ antiporter